MRRHNGDVFPCTFCQSTHTCKWQLQKHLEYKHGIYQGFEFSQSEDEQEEKDVKFMTLAREGENDKNKIMQLLPHPDDAEDNCSVDNESIIKGRAPSNLSPSF